MQRVSELPERHDGPVAPTMVEYTTAADDVLRTRRGMPIYGDRYVVDVEFAPGEARYFETGD
jgi:hypothetical protein